MIAELPIELPRDRLADFCQRHHIRQLSLFGSIVREDFGPDSDVDVLVEFETGHVPGLITFAGMEIELSELLGREVDLNTPGNFRPPLREKILQEAVPQYGAQT